MRKGLTRTLWTGASSGLPRSLPIMNSPPGREIISTPDFVMSSTGLVAPGFEELGRVSALLALPDESDFSQPLKKSAATPARQRKRENRIASRTVKTVFSSEAHAAPN